MLRDGGTYVEMGQFTDAGAIQTNWHRICTKDLTVLGSWGFTPNDLCWVARKKMPALIPESLNCFAPLGSRLIESVD